jgi:hypothetical protein
MFDLFPSKSSGRYFAIFFDQGVHDRPRSGEMDAIETVAQFLRDNPDLQATLEGHASKEGLASFNLWLSRARAATVKRLLVTAKVPADRIAEPTGVGAAQLIVPEDAHDRQELEWQRRQNRRVSIWFREKNSPLPQSQPFDWTSLWGRPKFDPLDPETIRKAIQALLPPNVPPNIIPDKVWKLPPRQDRAGWETWRKEAQDALEDIGQKYHFNVKDFLGNILQQFGPGGPNDPRPDIVKSPRTPPDWRPEDDK